MINEAWNGFKPGKWTEDVDVRDFIQNNYTPYEGNEDFLADPTERTVMIREKMFALFEEEQKRGGVYDVDTETVSTLTSHAPGYIDKDNEVIVGFQTDAPLRRAVNPFGGIKMTRKACEAYGYKLSEEVEKAFKYRTTHNDGVFSAYCEEIRAARHSGIITGLPDAYGRGRIIGDYRRVALYGIDRLIEEKKKDKKKISSVALTEPEIRQLEELSMQIKSLEEFKKMAASYGFDVSKPAKDSKEAVQWLYFGYLGANKEQNGAAMSLGRNMAFLDIYFERDLKSGKYTESEIQEMIDDFVMKLRMARHLRTPEYNDLFAGDPMWITEAIGGMGEDGRTLVTKSAFRILHTLYNLKPSAEPNMTVLWSEKLPVAFKRYVAKVSCDTDSIQYENDDVMRPKFGDDYAIACCVSAMRVGKDMQFFGARANLVKLLLLSLNGGRDEKSGEQVAPAGNRFEGEYLDYYTATKLIDEYRPWLVKTYLKALNIIHYMHDKYAYEKIEMAFHDTNIHRFLACGIAGLSVLADSLSAIKYAKVKVIRDETGLITDYETIGDFPKYGNDDDRVDSIVTEQVSKFFEEIKKNPTYRDAEHTLSILTITSNVVYGKKTGNTPDGRRAGEPFAPGANPMHGRDCCGALASLNSVSKISYDVCKDGISNTFCIVPDALGQDNETRYANLSAIIDGYFARNAQHLNVNVFNREMLIDASNHPEKYPNLTIRVSGYAVNFHKLSKEQQNEVIARTFHGTV